MTERLKEVDGIKEEWGVLGSEGTENLVSTIQGRNKAVNIITERYEINEQTGGRTRHSRN